MSHARLRSRLDELRDPIISACEHRWRYNFEHDDYSCDCGAWKPPGHLRPWRHRAAELLRAVGYRLDGVKP